MMPCILNAERSSVTLVPPPTYYSKLDVQLLNQKKFHAKFSIISEASSEYVAAPASYISFLLIHTALSFLSLCFNGWNRTVRRRK